MDPDVQRAKDSKIKNKGINMKKKLSIFLVIVMALTMLLSTPVLAAFDVVDYPGDGGESDCDCYDCDYQYECECECVYDEEEYDDGTGTSEGEYDYDECTCVCECGYYYGYYDYEYCVCECECGYYDENDENSGSVEEDAGIRSADAECTPENPCGECIDCFGQNVPVCTPENECGACSECVQPCSDENPCGRCAACIFIIPCCEDYPCEICEECLMIINDCEGANCGHCYACLDIGGGLVRDSAQLRVEIRCPVRNIYVGVWGYNLTDFPHITLNPAYLEYLMSISANYVDWTQWRIDFWTLGASISGGPGTPNPWYHNQQNIMRGPKVVSAPAELAEQGLNFSAVTIFRVYFEEAGQILSIEKESVTPGGAYEAGSVPVELGDTITYGVTVRNTGEASARNVEVVDNVPYHLTIDAAGILGRFGSDPPVPATTLVDNLTVSGQTVTWTIPELLVNQSFTLIIPTTVNETAPGYYVLRNVASITRENGFPVRAMHSNAIYHITPATEAPELSIVKSSNPAGGAAESGAVVVARGSTIYYYVTVTNAGPGVARDIFVWDEIPSYLSVDIDGISAQFGDDTPAVIFDDYFLFAWEYEGNYYAFWNIFRLGAGESFTVRIPTTVSANVPNNHIFRNVATLEFVDPVSGEWVVIDSNAIYHSSPRVYAGALPETGIDGTTLLWTSLFVVALAATFGTSILLKKEHGLRSLSDVTDNIVMQVNRTKHIRNTKSVDRKISRRFFLCIFSGVIQVPEIIFFVIQKSLCYTINRVFCMCCAKTQGKS